MTYTTPGLANGTCRGPSAAFRHIVVATERALSTRTAMVSRGAAHNGRSVSARTQRSHPRSLAGSTHSAHTGHYPLQAHTTRHTCGHALHSARDAVNAVLGVCWRCETSLIVSPDRPAQMRGLVRGQGDEEIRSTATSLWLETVEERGWERASGELSRVSGGMAARAAHHRARLDE